jgi:peptidoglycan/xylan/chitin deacetylase (PgdA/CDA1 family)
VGARVPILTYHKIAPITKGTIYPGTYVPPNLFEKHLRLLNRRGFSSVRVADLFSDRMPGQPILLTFDDGFQDFADNAWPLLQKHGFGGLVFLVLNHLGGQNEWDIAVGDKPAPLMNLETIRELGKQGAQFGSHTLSHPRLANLDEQDQRLELFAPLPELFDSSPQPSTICYPYGSYNQTTLDLARQAGYKFGFSTDKGLNDATTEQMRLKRIAIRHDTSVPALIYKLWRGFRYDR